MTLDQLNALFEGAAALLLALNIGQILHDRTVRGVHWGPLVFSISRGFWDLWYYHSLGQLVSLCAGLGVVLGNCVNLFLMWRFWPRAAVVAKTPYAEWVAPVAPWGPSPVGCPVENCRIRVPHSHTQAFIDRIKSQ